jgi:hypothetical protein
MGCGSRCRACILSIAHMYARARWLAHSLGPVNVPLHAHDRARAYSCTTRPTATTLSPSASACMAPMAPSWDGCKTRVAQHCKMKVPYTIACAIAHLTRRATIQSPPPPCCVAFGPAVVLGLRAAREAAPHRVACVVRCTRWVMQALAPAQHCLVHLSLPYAACDRCVAALCLRRAGVQVPMDTGQQEHRSLPRDVGRRRGRGRHA